MPADVTTKAHYIPIRLRWQVVWTGAHPLSRHQSASAVQNPMFYAAMRPDRAELQVGERRKAPPRDRTR